MKKRFLTLAMTVALAMSMSMTSWAGKWEKSGENWKYRTSDGPYATSGWHWITDNNVTLKCYYFDKNGILLTDTTTPDGFIVNEDGAWIVDGIVQTKRYPVHEGVPVSELNGKEVTDGKSVVPITLNYELADLLLVENSMDRFPDKTFLKEDDFGSVYVSQYRNKTVKVNSNTNKNCVTSIVGTVDQILDNIPADGIELMAFYENTGFYNWDARCTYYSEDRIAHMRDAYGVPTGGILDNLIIYAAVGPTGPDIFELGSAYTKTRFTDILVDNRYIEIVLTLGTDECWYIYPDSKFYMLSH